MTITVDQRKLKALINSVPDDLDKWLRGIAQSIENDIKLSFGTSPSPPGMPPGVVTGTLKGSIHVEPVKKLSYIVADRTDYGYILEMIKNRPFFQPVFEDWRRKIWDDLKSQGFWE